MLDFGKMSWVHAIWFVEGEDRDIMGCLYKDKEDGLWTLKYRFRYYNSDDPFGKEDEKHWFGMKARNAQADHLELARTFGEMCELAIRMGDYQQAHTVPVDGDAEKALALLSLQPWAHVKVQEHAEKPSGPAN